jgi:hypothetical protein
MKFLHLRWEPAVGTIVLALFALLAGTAFMWMFQHQAELDELHEELSGDVDEMVRQATAIDSQTSADQFQFNEKSGPWISGPAYWKFAPAAVTFSITRRSLATANCQPIKRTGFIKTSADTVIDSQFSAPAGYYSTSMLR